MELCTPQQADVPLPPEFRGCETAFGPVAFADRRNQDAPAGAERRQFADSRSHARPEVAELGAAVDRYKLMHRRRFITFEEMYEVIAALGYHK